jgi:hypothetical protein
MARDILFSAAGMTAVLNTREKVANKATSLSSASTDTEYPSAKAVYDALAEAEPLIINFETNPNYWREDLTTLARYFDQP